MDFFNSLSQVAKNRNNFKQWENKQHNEEAQREELARRRQYTPAELQKAKEYGDTIIDVVDVMDNHSENVAENVETAIDPLSSVATMFAFFGGNWLVGTKSTSKLQDQISKIKDEAYKSEEYRQLEKRVNEYCANNDIRTRYSDILNKRNIKKIKDPELRKDLSVMQKRISKETAKYSKQIIRNHGLVGLATIGVFIASTLFEAKLQTDSSKIARYQARKALDDPREFVTYTPEQIASAKKELEEHPELLKKEKKSVLKSGMIQSIYGILRDKRAYNNDKSAREDNSQKVTRPLTKEELIQAEKDKEVIQRTVRIINNEAEKNSENMEAAANVIMNTTPILGATVGAGTGWILDKFKVFDKFVENTIEKEGSADSQKLYKELKNSKKTGFSYLKQWFEFKDSMWHNEPIKNNTEGVKVKPKKANFNKFVKKIFATGFAHKSGKKWMLGIFGSITTGFAGMILALKLQKSAARAGRYTAKRELEKHPENFIGYTQEEYDEVKDVQNNKKKTNKIKEYALFIPNVIKQYWDYNNYRNHEFKERQALKDILKKQDISADQLRDAKNLQRKLFNTFEKVDDNSQVYSESMEAATEIAQPFVQYGGMLLALSPLIYTTVQTARGKISPAKLLDKITSKLSSGSNIMKKKWFKKYLGNVEKNITNVVNNVDTKKTVWTPSGKVELDIKPMGAILKDVNLQKDPITKVFSKVLENTNMSLEKFKKLSNEEQIKYLCMLKDSVRSSVEKIPNFKTNKIDNFFNVMINGNSYSSGAHIKMTSQLRADVMDFILNPKNIPTPERAEQAFKTLTMATGEELANTIAIFKPVLDQAKDFATSKNVQETLANLKAKIIETAQKADGKFPLNEKYISLLKKVIGEEKFNGCLSQGTQENIRIFLNNTKNQTIVKPDEIPDVVGIPTAEALKLAEVAVNRVKTATFKDAFNLLPTKLTNPKKVLTEFKTSIEKMSPEKFEEFAEFQLRMSSMDKETLLKIIPKIEKIFDNLPKEELDKITSKLVQEFNEHPDEVLKLLSTGKIANIFITPGLKKALVTAGISWTVFSVAMTYAVEAWLANMQLKAGRLGVMKAMESLDDPAYYANVEPTVQIKQNEQTTPSQTNNESNLLKRKIS